jgi:hypothetical protein
VPVAVHNEFFNTIDPLQTLKKRICSLQTGHSLGSCMNSSGDITKRVVPSRHSVLSFGTTCLEALHCTRSSESARRR